MISYEKYSTLTYINTKISKIQIYSFYKNYNYGRINQYPWGGSIV